MDFSRGSRRSRFRGSYFLRGKYDGGCEMQFGMISNRFCDVVCLADAVFWFCLF